MNKPSTRPRIFFLLIGIPLLSVVRTPADSEVYLLGVPDYSWHAGCFGTATGNLFGYWDRNGFPDFYTGPTAGGVAPLNDLGEHIAIRSMWASQAGLDGRPSNKPGHTDDYWVSYESTAMDPYESLGRAEHEPDCIGDFIGLSQKKWTNMNGECDGNIDAYSFVYWDPTGNKRINYAPPPDAGLPAMDIQSGLGEWTRYCGYEADVFTQLTDFNTNNAPNGFRFEDLKREINAGYPVLVFLQRYDFNFSPRPNMPRANPAIHGMLVYGYSEFGTDVKLARCRTSWRSGDDRFYLWQGTAWEAGLPVRGVIGYHPKPKITRIEREPGKITVTFTGPSVQLYDALNSTTTDPHWYVLDRSDTLQAGSFVPVSQPTQSRIISFADCCSQTAFFRIRMVDGP